MSYRNRLLVATPALQDPNFALAVILIVEHDADGALGIVLNRPSPMALPQSLDGWSQLACEPRVLFVGGPVQPDVVLMVGRSARPHAGAGAAADPATGQGPLPPGFALADPGQGPDTSALDDVRAFAGYAGWGAGQLDAEVQAGGWFVVDVQDDDVLTSDPAGLWTRVLRRQGGLFATATADPTAN